LCEFETRDAVWDSKSPASRLGGYLPLSDLNMHNLGSKWDIVATVGTVDVRVTFPTAGAYQRMSQGFSAPVKAPLQTLLESALLGGFGHAVGTHHSRNGSYILLNQGWPYDFGIGADSVTERGATDTAEAFTVENRSGHTVDLLRKSWAQLAAWSETV
jgi:hypothetical protein